MSVVIYGLKNCDKCKAALKHFLASGKEPDFIDLREETPPIDVLEHWIASEAGNRILNTRSTTWRALPEEKKTFDDDHMLAMLLSAHPTLIKRPVLVIDGAVHIGWSAKSPV